MWLSIDIGMASYVVATYLLYNFIIMILSLPNDMAS